MDPTQMLGCEIRDENMNFIARVERDGDEFEIDLGSRTITLTADEARKLKPVAKAIRRLSGRRG